MVDTLIKKIVPYSVEESTDKDGNPRKIYKFQSETVCVVDYYEESGSFAIKNVNEGAVLGMLEYFEDLNDNSIDDIEIRAKVYRPTKEELRDDKFLNYKKKHYVIKLKSGALLYGCWPNAGKMTYTNTSKGLYYEYKPSQIDSYWLDFNFFNRP